MLAPDGQQQLALRLGQRLGAASVLAPLGLERFEAALLVGVEPALEGGRRVGPGTLSPGWSEAFLAEPLELF